MNVNTNLLTASTIVVIMIIFHPQVYCQDQPGENNLDHNNMNAIKHEFMQVKYVRTNHTACDACFDNLHL